MPTGACPLLLTGSAGLRKRDSKTRGGGAKGTGEIREACADVENTITKPAKSKIKTGRDLNGHFPQEDKQTSTGP